MIYIREEFCDSHSVVIVADGILDSSSVPTLRNLCERHLEEHKKVLLRLEGLIRVSREGGQFLQEIQQKVTIIDPSRLTELGRLVPKENSEEQQN